jgi:hypothetical protein
MFNRTPKPPSAAEVAAGQAEKAPAQRILFRDEDLKGADAIVHVGTQITDAEYIAAGGVIVFGQLANNKLLTTNDKSPVIIAMTGTVEGGAIEAQDLLVEGKVIGAQITAEGRIEIGPGAQVSGTLLKGPMAEVYIAPTADVSEMTMRAMHARAAQSVPTLRNGTHD